MPKIDKKDDGTVRPAELFHGDNLKRYMILTTLLAAVLLSAAVFAEKPAS